MKPLFLLLAVLLITGCSGASAEQVASPSPQGPEDKPTPDMSASGLLLDQRGISMSLEKSVHYISFRPTLPLRKTDAIAVIPPLGGDDSKETRGIAFEYNDANARFILSEWPAQKFSIAFGGTNLQESVCTPFLFGKKAYAWADAQNHIYTLLFDGKGTLKHLAKEAERIRMRQVCH